MRCHARGAFRLTLLAMIAAVIALTACSSSKDVAPAPTSLVHRVVWVGIVYFDPTYPNRAYWGGESDNKAMFLPRAPCKVVAVNIPHPGWVRCIMQPGDYTEAQTWTGFPAFTSDYHLSKTMPRMP